MVESITAISASHWIVWTISIINKSVRIIRIIFWAMYLAEKKPLSYFISKFSFFFPAQPHHL